MRNSSFSLCETHCYREIVSRGNATIDFRSAVTTSYKLAVAEVKMAVKELVLK